jgi:hypothetical protein
MSHLSQVKLKCLTLYHLLINKKDVHIVKLIILFSHANHDCNTFRRQIQSAINEGRLKFHEMQVDRNPFPNSAFVNTLEWSNL